jgi:hypothetical protein
MQMLIALLLALLASTQALSQNATDNPATDKPVTFAELEGSIVDAKIVRQQVVRRADSTFPVRVQSISKITIRADDWFDVTWYSINDTPRGVRQGKTLSGSYTLNRPAEVNPANLGGGHGVWKFSDGTLTMLRTYKEGGAFKTEISFSRTAGGFACTANEAFAREGGTGPVVFNSAVDGVQVAILSWKQLSSDCQVSQAQPGPAQSVDVKPGR